MKSVRTESIDRFWNWFSSIAEAFGANVEDRALLDELDHRVRDLSPELSWEVGPGLSKPWQLAISPNLDRDLRKTAQLIVSRAPVLPGWEFHAARQAKAWDYRLELGRAGTNESVDLDASAWTFVLLRFPDGAHEVLLRGRDLPQLTDDERWQAAAITLESVLGEDLLLDRITEFELVDQLEPRFSERERPIQQLRDAVVGR